MPKNPAIESFLQGLSVGAKAIGKFAQTREQAQATHTCIKCGGEAEWFKNDRSAKEYRLSFMCQQCQDVFFGGDDNG